MKTVAIADLWPLLLIPGLWLLRPAPRLARLPLWALGLGALIGWIAATYQANFHVSGGRYIASDFGRYCGNLAAMMHGRWEDWHLAASLAPGWILSPLAARVGVVDALAWGAVGGSAVIAAACAVWAGVIGGRLAGAAAALFTLALGPFVLLSRSLTFYPVQVAAYTLALAGASAAMVRRSPLTLLLGGVGVGAALLVDVRGLMVALPATGMLLIAAARGPWRRLPLRLALVALPLVGSWSLGARAYPAEARSLEMQVMALDVRRQVAHRLPKPPYVPQSRYVWGRTPIQDIPYTLLELQRTSASLAPATVDLPMNVQGRAQHLAPWTWPVAVALGLALWGLRRRPWHLLTLALSLVPAAMTVNSVATLELRLRFLAPAAPGLAVLLGVAFAAAVSGPIVEEDAEAWPRLPRARPPLPLREPVALALLLALLTGALPSWLSPVAPRNHPEATGQIGKALDAAWATEWETSPEARRAQVAALAQAMGEAHTEGWEGCEAQLAADVEAGFELGGGVLRPAR